MMRQLIKTAVCLSSEFTSQTTERKGSVEKNNSVKLYFIVGGGEANGKFDTNRIFRTVFSELFFFFYQTVMVTRLVLWRPSVFFT